jgi:aminoglycoside 3-N-acetyltransferase
MTDEHAPRLVESGPVDREHLAADLRALGLRRGQDLLIHCSLSRIGWVDGGPATLLSAILEVAGPAATLVVPTETTWNSLTSNAFRAATEGLDDAERARHIARMPGFDPATTPSAGMGAFAEHVRTRPAAHRSGHPQTSFAAIGPQARACTAIHDLDCHLGDRSPIGWLYAADAAILFLGVGYSVCTAFHLAEYRLPGPVRLRAYHCFTVQGGTRVAHEFTDIYLDDSDFELIGAELDAVGGRDSTSGLRRGQIGVAECRLVPFRLAVDFACSWLAYHRRKTSS